MDVIKLFATTVFISWVLIACFDQRLEPMRREIKEIKMEVKERMMFEVEPATTDQIITQAAKRWGFHPAILHAVAEIESSKNLKVGAVSEPNKTKSYGIFQINDVLAKDERAKPEELIRDVELGAHIAAKKIGFYCRAKIAKGKTLKEQAEIAYGCYRGANKDGKLYSRLKVKGQLKTIKSFWG